MRSVHNAACWECRYHCLIPAILDSDTVRVACSVSGTPVIMAKMPQKCEKREKAK